MQAYLNRASSRASRRPEAAPGTRKRERINTLTTALRTKNPVLRTGSKAVPPTATAGADALEVVLRSLDESKAEDAVPINIVGKSTLADFMVVASGRSHRHVGAIADRVVEDLESAGFASPRVEGVPHCDWVLIDAGDVIVHIFRPEVRGFYNLEKMWTADHPSGPVLTG
jgi:ribosome-associated protein